MSSKTLLEELLVKNSELFDAWLKLEILLDKVSVRELSPGVFQMGDTLITGEEGLKAFDEALKAKVKKDYV